MQLILFVRLGARYGRRRLAATGRQLMSTVLLVLALVVAGVALADWTQTLIDRRWPPK